MPLWRESEGVPQILSQKIPPSCPGKAESMSKGFSQMALVSGLMAGERIIRQIGRLLDEANEADSRSDWTLVRDLGGFYAPRTSLLGTGYRC